MLLNLEQTTDLQDTLFYLGSQIPAMKKKYATRNITDFVYLMLCLSFDCGFLFCFVFLRTNTGHQMWEVFPILQLLSLYSK